MSRDQHFQRRGTDSSQLSSNTAFHASLDPNLQNFSSSYHVLGRCLDTFNSSNIPNLPIFKDSKMQPISISTSALQAIQNYGRGMQSPVPFSPKREFTGVGNFNQPNTLTGLPTNIQSPSDTFFDQLPDSESSATFSDTVSCKPFTDLNLKTVDEEDEFLYGDSNSLPEIPKSVKGESSSLAKDAGHHIEWSDDDIFEEYPGTSQTKLSSNNKQVSSVWDTHNKITETKNLSLREQEKMSVSNEKMLSKKTPIEQLHSYTETSLSLAADVKRMAPKTSVTNIATDKMSQGTSNAGKSKYHVAAEILKKQVLQKNSSVSKSSSNEKLDALSDVHRYVESKWISDVSDNKSSEKEKLGIRMELKTDKASAKQSRLLPKAFAQKHLDNIKDYLKKPERKRVHPEGYEHDTKHPRHENTCRLSPERRHSPYDSSRYRSSDDYKYRSSYYHKSPERDSKYQLSSHQSRHRDDREYDKYSRDRNYYERNRHYSRSPGRRSRERSPGYPRYKARSPSSHHIRERSKSPSYRIYESKYKNVTAKSSDKSPSYTKSKRSKENDSGSSFCSLSLESESDSSSDSSDSSKEKGGNVKHKTSVKGENTKASTNKIESALDNLAKAIDTPFMSEDVSKKFSDGNKSKTEEEELINITKILESSKMLTQFYHDILGEKPSTFMPSAPVASAQDNMQTYSATNSQIPLMSNPSSYSYPVMNAVPMPFPPPTVSGYPVIPPPTFPSPPVIPTVPSVPSVYDPYSALVPATEAKYVKKRTPTLRTIELGPSTSSNSPPGQSSELKGKEAPLQSVPGSARISEQQKNALIEKYKKLKYDRHIAQSRMNHALEDVIEMRGMLTEVFGKKPPKSEDVIHIKCKNLVHGCSGDVNKYVNAAKRVDEEIKRFKAKLPQELQTEILNLKIEDYKEEEATSNATYIIKDSNDHLCYPCNKQLKNISNYLEHIQSSEHKKQCASDDSWKKHFKKEKPPEEKKSGVHEAVEVKVKGMEFLKPLNGFYCSLCRETILDSTSAELHVTSHDHHMKYVIFTKNHPLCMTKCVFKRLIQCSHSMKQKKAKEVAARIQKLAEHRKREEDADKKIKEIIEIGEESEDSNLEDQKSTSAKLASSSKEKIKPDEPKTKTVQKFIYIGKAPYLKKSSKHNSKPWYKRESILNKGSDEANSTLSSPVIGSKESTDEENLAKAEKSSVCKDELQKSSKIKEVEMQKSNKSVKTTKSSTPKAGINNKSSESSVKYTCLTEEEVKSTSCVKSVKSSSEHSQNSGKNSTQYSDNFAQNKEQSMPRSADSVVNQAIKNILHGADASAHRDISLSDITLPQSAIQNETKNIPIPMDIDNSQDPECNPKLATEEEKDFYILGINKDDLAPLVIPVPPPSSMITYSNNTSNYLPANDVKQFDFSVPPPTLLPYSRNTPPPPPRYPNMHGQSVHPYSNPSNVMPVSFPNAGNAHLYPYSNPNVPPPRLSFPTSNHHNMPPSYIPYSAATNSSPRPIFSNQNNSSFLSPNLSRDLNKGNLNNVSSGSKIIPVSPSLQNKSVKKQGPELKQAGNLITIVPNKSNPPSKATKLSSNSSILENSKGVIKKEETTLLENNKEEEKDIEIINSSNEAQINSNDGNTVEQNIEITVKSSNFNCQGETSLDLKICDKEKIQLPTTSDEKVEAKSGEKVEAKSDEKVEAKSDEKVEAKSGEKVEEKSSEHFEKKSEENFEEKCEEREVEILDLTESEKEIDSQNVEICENTSSSSSTIKHTETDKESSTSRKYHEDNVNNQDISESMDEVQKNVTITATMTSVEESSVEKSVENIQASGTVCETSVIPSTVEHTDTTRGNSPFEQCQEASMHNENLPENMDIEDKKTTSVENSLDDNIKATKNTELSINCETSTVPSTGEECSDVTIESSLGHLQEVNLHGEISCKHMDMTSVESPPIEKPLTNNLKENVQLAIPSTAEPTDTTETSSFDHCQETSVHNQILPEHMDIDDKETASVEKSLDGNIIENFQGTEKAELFINSKSATIPSTEEVCIDITVDSSLEQCQEGNSLDENFCKSMDMAYVESSSIEESVTNKLKEAIPSTPNHSNTTKDTLTFEQCKVTSAYDQNLSENMDISDQKVSCIEKSSVNLKDNIQASAVPSAERECSALEQCQETNIDDKDLCENMNIEDQDACMIIDTETSDQKVSSIEKSSDNLKENIQESSIPLVERECTDITRESSALGQCQETNIYDKDLCENMNIEDQDACIIIDTETSNQKVSSIEQSSDNLKENIQESSIPLVEKECTDITRESSTLGQCQETNVYDKDVCENMNIEDQDACIIIDTETLSVENISNNDLKEHSFQAIDTDVKLRVICETSTIHRASEHTDANKESSELEQCQVNVHNQNVCENMNVEDKKYYENEHIKASVEQLNDNSSCFEKSNTDTAHSLMENVLKEETALCEMEVKAEMKSQSLLPIRIVDDENCDKVSNDESINVLMGDLNKLSELMPSTNITNELPHDNFKDVVCKTNIKSYSENVTVSNVEDIPKEEQDTSMEEQSNGINVKQYHEPILQNQNTYESSEFEGQKCSINMDVDMVEQSSNYSKSDLEESKADSTHKLPSNAVHDTVHKDESLCTVEDKSFIENQTDPSSVNMESGISCDEAEVSVNEDVNIKEDTSKSSKEETLSVGENISFENTVNLVQNIETCTPAKKLEQKEQESCLQYENSQCNITSSQTFADFADISSTLAKLQRAVSEFRSRPELQANKSEVSEALKSLKLVSEAFKLATDCKETEDRMKTDNLPKSAPQEREMEIDSLPKQVHPEAESKIESKSLAEPALQEAGSKMEAKTLPESGNCNESDTDEYENEQ